MKCSFVRNRDVDVDDNTDKDQKNFWNKDLIFWRRVERISWKKRTTHKEMLKNENEEGIRPTEGYTATCRSKDR